MHLAAVNDVAKISTTENCEKQIRHLLKHDKLTEVSCLCIGQVDSGFEAPRSGDKKQILANLEFVNFLIMRLNF